ncbi:hypothetical protein PR048_032974 [Dryococelus australis]|uniref:Uncharacterized protein n=1 Tax=Dryococelus australis TaxID=614101 RepID=A0ABQ9G3R1_9NEOP|nr:hypothetical protein PR048_032974 [Dryococelus australis]
MPKEQAKYGIKLLCLIDVNYSYLYNAYIYRGKGSDGAPPFPSRVKTPNSSSAQAVKLLKHGLTLVATMKANKPQIQPEFLPNKTRAVGSRLYGFTKKLTLYFLIQKLSFYSVLCTILNSMTLQLANQKSFCFTMRQNLGLTLLI